MRRVTLFVNGTSKNGKVVAVYGTLSDLLSVASNKLGIRASSLYNGKGGLIDDIALISFIISDRQQPRGDGVFGFVHTYDCMIKDL
uniref:Potassium channel tetramerization domain containing 9a n=1 Tax=Myripristis murdjan TaxID=586833 RepID=A0A667Z9J2_9TELE